MQHDINLNVIICSFYSENKRLLVVLLMLVCSSTVIILLNRTGFRLVIFFSGSY